MVALYLVLRMALPLLAAWLVGAALLRIAHRHAARLPAQPLLPERSQLPTAAAQRRYQRMLRRRPMLRTLTRPAPMPRRWALGVVMGALAALIATVVVLPNGARFQVLLERAVGYPATIIEVPLPPAQQAQVLQAWQPVLQYAARPVQMRYRIARTAGETTVHDVQPVWVRQQNGVLQLATALPLDHAALRQALAESARLAPARVQLRDEMRFAPAWQPGWKAMAQ